MLRIYSMKIPFNKPCFIGKELDYISQAVKSGKISGDGIFTKKCHDFFESTYGFRKVLLTTSCTDALEMAAILLDIKEGDEVIMPSYTFVSTANAFVLRGAKIVFIDSCSNHPNMDVTKIESLINPKTKAIIAVHYAGVACDMDVIMELAKTHNLFVVEDAAQSIHSFYKGKPLGSIGHFAAFSFHETKNVSSGEGGMLVINDAQFINRAEIIREKGTNRSQFFRGEINKYDWVDIGSSFLPSDINAAFLYAQLENVDKIQKKRMSIWTRYYDGLKSLENSKKVILPKIPDYATNNAHIFYLICNSENERTKLIEHLKADDILAVFHYLSLHKSPYYKAFNDNKELIQADFYTNRLVRLPLFYDLSARQQNRIINSIRRFYNT
jgi:dTDP-4-amino-4,6-dideoxygalactose transaminase